MLKLILSGLGLLLLSCSHAATGSNTPLPGSEAICSPSIPCTVAGEFCDYLYPLKSNQGQGICTTSCQSNGDCTDGKICNPISGGCETRCNSNNNLCRVQGSNLGVCMGTYCALPATGSTCPSPTLKESAGFCKLACSGITCPNGQACDPITGTCEIGCTATGGQCAVLSTLQISATSNTAYACSLYSSTCVASCTQPAQCPGIRRAGCSGIGGGSGTCEISCTGSCPEPLACKNDAGFCGKTCSDNIKDCQPGQTCKFNPQICWGDQ